jgi:hypothetical protein
VWVHFWVFNSISLVYLSIIVTVPCCFFFFFFFFFVVVVVFGFVSLFDHNWSIVQLEVRHGDSTRGSFIIEKSFCYPRVFFFYST